MRKRTPDWENSKCLLPKTADVLKRLAKLPLLQQFTFVGGSALAIYLCHRLSEDIDLFTWKADLDKEFIFKQIQAHFQDDEIELLSESINQLNFSLANIKVSFFANNWERLKNKHIFFENLSIAEFMLITGMKINTLFLRAKFRDYYDLYCIEKSGISIQTMYQTIEDIMPGMNKRLFQMAITYTEDIVDDEINHLSPKYAVNKIEVARHFEQKVFEWLK